MAGMTEDLTEICRENSIVECTSNHISTEVAYMSREDGEPADGDCHPSPGG